MFGPALADSLPYRRRIIPLAAFVAALFTTWLATRPSPAPERPHRHHDGLRGVGRCVDWH